MKNLKNKLKNKLKNNKKGFTLVEIIVVLVILAVLAAAAIPTMLGFVEEAKGKSEIANARAAYVAAQSVVTEETATGETTEISKLTDSKGYTITAGKGDAKKFDKMVGKDLENAKVRVTDATADGKIDKFEYQSTSGYLVTITPGSDAVVLKGGTIS